MKAVALPFEPLSGRLQALTLRERLFLGVGAGAILLFLLFVLMPSSDSAEPVELAQAPPPAAAIPAPTYTPPPPAAPAPAASASGLLLRGVLASGAILIVPGGGERVVPIGREFLPGLTLKQVGVEHAIVGGAGGDVRLDLGKAGATAVQSASAPSPSPSARSADAATQQRETLDYRLGLQPTAGKGYAIKPGARLPHLDRAGLQPGDVIVAVNGSRFDEERMMELSWEIANAPRTEFEVIRGGRKMKLALQPAN